MLSVHTESTCDPDVTKVPQRDACSIAIPAAHENITSQLGRINMMQAQKVGGLGSPLLFAYSYSPFSETMPRVV